MKLTDMIKAAIDSDDNKRRRRRARRAIEAHATKDLARCLQLLERCARTGPTRYLPAHDQLLGAIQADVPKTEEVVYDPIDALAMGEAATKYYDAETQS